MCEKKPGLLPPARKHSKFSISQVAVSQLKVLAVLAFSIPLGAHATPKTNSLFMAYLDISPGAKITEMLRASGGNLGTLELTIKKQFERRQTNNLEGEYVNAILLEQMGWDEDMIKNSYQWALSRGLARKSEVHGKEEWKIPLKESFSFQNTNIESGEATGSTEVEDWLMITCVHMFDQEQLPFM